MEFFKKVTSIDFLGRRKPFMIASAIIVLLSIASIVVRGFNFGIDFTGGTLLEVGFKQPVELTEVRSALDESGFRGAIVQHFGTLRDVLVRLPPTGEEADAKLSDLAFKAVAGVKGGEAELRRVEFVGPQVGDELTEDGGLAILYSLIGILIYVALRFEYRFAVGAIIATLHDVIITVGIFSLFQIEFDLTVLAAVLAVIGYSLNDTIVVFDRIRELFRKVRKGSVVDVINQALNQTLSRTIMTSGTTLLTITSLYIFGGGTISGFALALMIGIVVGTYSSIYVASASLVALGVTRADLTPPQKEGAGAQPESLP